MLSSILEMLAIAAFGSSSDHELSLVPLAVVGFCDVGSKTLTNTTISGLVPGMARGLLALTQVARSLLGQFPP